MIENHQLHLMNNIIQHRQYVTVANQGRVYVYDAERLEFCGSFEVHESGNVFSPMVSVGKHLWTIGQSVVRVWSFESLEKLKLLTERVVGDSKIEPLIKWNSRVFSGSFDGEVIEWNSITCSPLHEVIPTSSAITCLETYEDWLIVSNEGDSLFVFDMHELHPPDLPQPPRRMTFRSLKLSISCLSPRAGVTQENFSPRGKRMSRFWSGIDMDTSTSSPGLVSTNSGNLHDFLTKLSSPCLSLETPIRLVDKTGKQVAQISLDSHMNVSRLIHRVIPPLLDQQVPFGVYWFSFTPDKDPDDQWEPIRFRQDQLHSPIGKFILSGRLLISSAYDAE